MGYHLFDKKLGIDETIYTPEIVQKGLHKMAAPFFIQSKETIMGIRWWKFLVFPVLVNIKTKATEVNVDSDSDAPEDEKKMRKDVANLL